MNRGLLSLITNWLRRVLNLLIFMTKHAKKSNFKPNDFNNSHQIESQAQKIAIT